MRAGRIVLARIVNIHTVNPDSTHEHDDPDDIILKTLETKIRTRIKMLKYY